MEKQQQKNWRLLLKEIRLCRCWASARPVLTWARLCTAASLAFQIHRYTRDSATPCSRGCLIMSLYANAEKTHSTSGDQHTRGNRIWRGGRGALHLAHRTSLAAVDLPRATHRRSSARTRGPYSRTT